MVNCHFPRRQRHSLNSHSGYELWYLASKLVRFCLMVLRRHMLVSKSLRRVCKRKSQSKGKLRDFFSSCSWDTGHEWQGDLSLFEPAYEFAWKVKNNTTTDLTRGVAMVSEWMEGHYINYLESHCKSSQKGINLHSLVGLQGMLALFVNATTNVSLNKRSGRIPVSALKLD